MANEPLECPLTMNGDVIGKATVQLHPDGTVEILSSEVDVHLLLKHSQKMFEDLTLSVPMSMAPTEDVTGDPYGYFENREKGD